MKSLDELIEEIRREVSGEREAEPDREAPETEVPAGDEFDLDLDVDLDLGEEIPSQAPAAVPPPAPAPRDLAPAPPPPAPEVVPSAPAAPRLPAPDELFPPPPRRTVEAPPERTFPERDTEDGRRPVRRRFRRVLLVALAAALGAGAWFGLRLLGEGEPGTLSEPPVAVPLADQDVVLWAVWDEDAPDVAFVTVIGAGGEMDPVALGIPAYTVVNIPGYGLATVGDAVALQDAALVAAAVENLLGVKVDAEAGLDIEGLGRLVDALGGVGVGTETMTGERAVKFLTRSKGEAGSAEFRFLRWQEMTAGILAALDGRPEALAELPEDVAAALLTAGSGGAEVLELPVEDIGAGLARPLTEEVRALVLDRFVPTAKTAREVRLVVLNGEGTPGIGERVARVLVPSGFRLVSSLNAETFNVKETQIIASSEEFLPEARLAQDLLGVGGLFLGEQPTGVADVTVIIGADFGGP